MSEQKCDCFRGRTLEAGKQRPFIPRDRLACLLLAGVSAVRSGLFTGVRVSLCKPCKVALEPLEPAFACRQVRMAAAYCLDYCSIAERCKGVRSVFAYIYLSVRVGAHEIRKAE